MGKKTLFPLFLLVLLPLSAQQVKLSMDILGWSGEGLFCWVETRGDLGMEKRTLFIVDLVTDETVFSEEIIPSSDGRALARSKGIRTENRGTSVQGSRLVSRGVLYDIELFSESDRVSVRLKNISDGTYKEVNTAPLGGDEIEIRGSVISPYENRAALVFLRKGAGHAEYIVMGAHLGLGFKPIPLETEPLLEAVLNGQFYLCRLLLSEGTLPDSVRDPRGYTPLMLAARNGKWRIAGLLLDYGAKSDIRDGEGKSPADYAREAG
ncbi:MAG: ankyrin repeat domain-containing protein, partial [Spirochaetales bacterium]|nr:ankyrin repeat domain-containing protein [Spirochaetales bacterium]